MSARLAVSEVRASRDCCVRSVRHRGACDPQGDVEGKGRYEDEDADDDAQGEPTTFAPVFLSTGVPGAFPSGRRTGGAAGGQWSAKKVVGYRLFQGQPIGAVGAFEERIEYGQRDCACQRALMIMVEYVDGIHDCP